MTANLVSAPWQLTGGFLTLITIILALYNFLLNPQRQANRFVSLATILLGISSVGVMVTIHANTYTEAIPGLVSMAAAAPASGPALILATLALLKPNWIQGRMGWLWVVILALTLVPVLLTAVDLIQSRGLYLVLPDPAEYSGGYLEPESIMTGVVGRISVQVGLIYLKLALLVLLIYLSFVERAKEPGLRSVARYLFVSLLISWLFEFLPGDIFPDGLSTIISGVILTTGYVYAAYRHMKVTRSLQSGRLQIRLTTLTAAITIPLIIYVAWFLLGQAEDLLEQRSHALLEQYTTALDSTVEQVTIGYVRTLQSYARQPEIVSMDPTRQKPVLEALALSYPSLYLVSTIDRSGMNVARSDDAELADYSDRFWFQEVMSGKEYSLQTLIGRTIGQPALVIAVPILDAEQRILGVCLLASRLTEISDQVLTVSIGETGYAYVVDEKYQLVAHPELLPGSTELVDYSEALPITALRAGKRPPIVYQDENGVEWLAYYKSINNGWSVVVQQETREISDAVQGLRGMATSITLVGSAMLLGLVLVTVRQTVRPVTALTKTVQEIASGNFNQTAPIESDDEFGTLAVAFNSMTLQVRNLVEGLERRVAERTLDLEHRSAQLQAAAEVGRAAANIRNLDELLPLVTHLVSERFGFYHVGIFLLDDNHEYAVLRAANSEGGQRMLERRHRLRVGQQGIVGYVCERREPRIVLNVGEDAVFFMNPDLPDTQSEMALPLAVGATLLGALDVQSTSPAAFTEQDVRTLQVLADQVAIAINSARLVNQLEQALESERRVYSQISQRAWLEQARGQANQGFSRTVGGVIPVKEIKEAGVRNAITAGNPVVSQANPAILFVPVKVRGIVLGVLKLTRSDQDESWSDEDTELPQKLAEQLGVALESARAYQTTQTSAQQDRVLAAISSRVRETLDIEAILRAATQEVQRALGLPKVVVQLGLPDTVDHKHAGENLVSSQENMDQTGQPAGDDEGILSQGADYE